VETVKREPGERAGSGAGASVLLYDGECGLCQFTVRWMLGHDREGRLLFAQQQGAVGRAVFERHGLDMKQVDSVVLVSWFEVPGERVALRSDAILEALTVLGGGWRWVAGVGRLVPRGVRDAVYRWVARNRMRLFGGADVCAVLSEAERARFL
jgi:predicted DCC family thiol-disulfide oxidoreductase YuxK